ncbi:uncharacterized protein LOC129808655 [Phlebotomus papatasi]|uniref:uncharacterized protein LOC129808655 n=1 Tax=Phlebotomus papatasi TaxID=29031 RepID=UPI002483F3CE|nr:uncharacterized protein LOC129808655 [Phlebotomus papatasi]
MEPRRDLLRNPSEIRNIIKDFKDRPMLWDMSHEHYYNVIEKQKELQSFAEKYNTTEKELSNKLRYLKKTYTDERFERRRPSTANRCPWRYFADMNFLEKNFEMIKKLPKGIRIAPVPKNNPQPRIKIKRPADLLAPIAQPPNAEPPAKRPKTAPNRTLSEFEDSKDSEDSLDSEELFSLSPISRCASPTYLDRLTTDPKEKSIALKFIHDTSDILSAKKSSLSAFFDFIKIKFDEKNISKEKFEEFVHWTTDFVDKLDMF